MDAGSRVLDLASLPTDVALDTWLADDRGSPALRARHLLGVLRQLQLADPDILRLAGASDDDVDAARGPDGLGFLPVDKRLRLLCTAAAVMLRSAPLRFRIAFRRDELAWPAPPPVSDLGVLQRDVAADGYDVGQRLNFCAAQVSPASPLPVPSVVASPAPASPVPVKQRSPVFLPPGSSVPVRTPGRPAASPGPSAATNQIASLLGTPGAAEQLMEVVQQLVLQPGFVLPRDLGSVRQVREHTEWALPTRGESPELWQRLPASYPDLDSGHESALRLTKDERRLIRNGVPYHRGFPEPAKLDPNHQAQCSAATIKKYNELRQDILALRPRVNAQVFLLAQLFDPSITDIGVLRERLAGTLQNQLDLLLDDSFGRSHG
eukprot:SAG31_NODE_512_length_14721_cov_17.995623_18_plen_378_part_00